MRNKILQISMEVIGGAGNVEVVDSSRKHAGHGGYGLVGESHFELTIAGKKLGLKERLELHKRLNAAFMPVYAAGVHSIEIKIKQT